MLSNLLPWLREFMPDFPSTCLSCPEIGLNCKVVDVIVIPKGIATFP